MRHDGKLTNHDLFRTQLREYCIWLESHPDARVIVFPASKSKACLRDEVRRELLGGFRERAVVTVDLDDYKAGLPPDEPVVSTTDEIAKWVDPTGGLRAAGILIIGAVGDRP